MSSRAYFAWRMVEEAELADERREQKSYEARMRALMNPLRYKTERKFIKMYRLSKQAFEDLCEVLHDNAHLRSSQRVSLEAKVLCALLFYAKGGYQCATGEANHVSQQTMSVYIEEVTKALIHPNVLSRFLRFPSTREERDAIKQRFYSLYGIPGVIGCIDGCHFKIFKPKKDIEHLYYCRKHYHSINAQVICDADSKILAVNPKYGGATHDAFIWENSNINNYMQMLHRDGERVWLLGDSGYPQRPWIMTPYTPPAARSNAPPPALTPMQELYNEKHSKARVIIENTFGRVKNRWRCCIKYRAPHYKPIKCAEIITACCVLHNFALEYNVPDPIDDDSSSSEDGSSSDGDNGGDTFQRHEEVVEEESNSDLLRGRAVRDQLARRLL